VEAILAITNSGHSTFKLEVLAEPGSDEEPGGPESLNGHFYLKAAIPVETEQRRTLKPTIGQIVYYTSDTGTGQVLAAIVTALGFRARQRLA